MSTAAGTGRPRRRALWVALGAVAVAVVVGLAFLLGTTLARPQQASAQPTPTPAPSEPAAAPSAAPSAAPTAGPAASSAQQHQEYRAYVSAALSNSAAVVAALGGLTACRDSHDACLTSLSKASEAVAAFEADLKANPAPPCLAGADERLHDALTFWKRGLSTAHDAVQSQNRVQLAQGLLLTAAGTWRAGQAAVDARQADC